MQRGGERLHADLCRWLAATGHDVWSISTSAAEATSPSDGAVHEIRHRPSQIGSLGRLRIDRAITYLPQLALDLRRLRPDVAHGLFHLDGVAARLAGTAPYLVHVQGIPRREAIERLPVHRRLLGPSLRRAAAVVAVSRAAADALEEEFGTTARVVLNGVFTEDFADAAAGVQRSPKPTVLFPGDPADPRKRLDALVEAVAMLRASWPDLTLAVAARLRPEHEAALRARLGDALDPWEVSGPSAMPAAYGRAWVTCLPAVREAFGLVIVESLASGTPAVAVADGGVPEVLAEPAWLAPPDDAEGLAAALDDALRAADEAGTPDRCRALAAPFDWSQRGPALVALYEEVVAAS